VLVDPTFTLPNARLPGLAVTDPEPDPPVPVPETETCCGLLGSLSVMVSVAVRVPETVGLNRRVTVQLELPARLDPHVLLKIAKAPGSAPVRAMLPMLTAEVPELVSVTGFCPPALPTATLPQVIAVGDATM
jgi:hypothetical protein